MYVLLHHVYFKNTSLCVQKYRQLTEKKEKAYFLDTKLLQGDTQGAIHQGILSSLQLCEKNK